MCAEGLGPRRLRYCSLTARLASSMPRASSTTVQTKSRFSGLGTVTLDFARKLIEEETGLPFATATAKAEEVGIDAVGDHAVEVLGDPERLQGVVALVRRHVHRDRAIAEPSLDALHHAYVDPGLPPPGAFVPEDRA